MTRRAVGPSLVLLVLLAPLGACSPDGGDTDSSRGQGVPVTAPSVDEATEPGEGMIAVGGSTSRFAVTECRLEPDPADPEGARALVALSGAGRTDKGVAFTVELQRFATGTAVVTYTDTVTFSDSARILQAQRIEVEGQVTDLRDADATSALIRSRKGGVSASGLASAPGNRGDDGGLIGIALDAMC